MALDKCRECGQRISSKAPFCPSCGAPHRSSSKNMGCGSGCAIVLALGIVAVIASNIISSQETARKQREARQCRVRQQEEKQKADQIAKEAFVANIDTHYAELKQCASQKDAPGVIAKADEFRKHGMLDFKDVKTLYAKNREVQLLQQFKGTNAKDYRIRYNICSELTELFPENAKYKEAAEKLGKQVAEIERKEAEERRKKEEEKKRQEARKKKIEEQFSAWDGSHRTLTGIIKKSMNDPDSYEHVETVYWDRGNHLVIKTTFRGKNAFGGLVINWVKAKVDLDGNVLQIIAQGP